MAECEKQDPVQIFSSQCHILDWNNDIQALPTTVSVANTGAGSENASLSALCLTVVDIDTRGQMDNKQT